MFAPVKARIEALHRPVRRGCEMEAEACDCNGEQAGAVPKVQGFYEVFWQGVTGVTGVRKDGA